MVKVVSDSGRNLMIEVFIGIILIFFFGLFVALSFPLKDEAAKLNKKSKGNPQQSSTTTN